MDNPKAFVSAGIHCLEQAVLAVMDDEWLESAEISQRLDIPAYGDYNWRYAIVRGILRKLAEDGRVDHAKKSRNLRIWKRTD